MKSSNDIANEAWSRVVINRLNERLNELAPLLNLHTDATSPLQVMPDSNGVYFGLDAAVLAPQIQSLTSPSCQVVLATATSLPNGQNTLQWDSAKWDTDGYWDGVNKNRLNVSDPNGLYVVEARVNLLVPNTEAGKTFDMTLVDSNGVNVALVTGQIGTSIPPSTNSNVGIYLAAQVNPASDSSPAWYEVQLYNQSSVAWPVDVGGGYMSRFGITRIG